MKRPRRTLLLTLLVTVGLVVPSVPSSPLATTVDAASPLPVTLAAARHVGYTFDSVGNVRTTSAAVLAAPSSVSATARRAIPGRGVHLLLATGPLAGYYVRESGIAHVRGIVGQRIHSPTVRVPFAAGTYLGYRFDDGWKLAGTKKGVLSAASGARADRSAVINGRPYVRMATGYWTGRWIPGTVAAAQRITCSPRQRAAAGSTQLISSVPAATGRLALTFDMGGRLDPARAILEYLVLERACTTIFPTGAAAQSTEGKAVMAVILQHPELFEVGNHTMHHCNLRDGGGGARCPATRPTTAFIQRELADAEAVVRAATGQTTKPYWRPPYGAQDATLRTAAAGAGYTKTIMWSIDTIDWRPVSQKGPTAYDIALKIRTNARSGSIVLLHLGGYNTLEALPWTMAGLRDAGLRQATISELLR